MVSGSEQSAEGRRGICNKQEVTEKIHITELENLYYSTDISRVIK